MVVKNDKILLTVMAVGLSLMLILRDVFDVGMNKFLYLAFVVVCMAMANYRTLVSMICFILPLVCGLPATYIMPCAVALLIFKRGKLGLVSIFFVISLSLLEIVASFWYPTPNVPDLVQYISFIAVVILLIHEREQLDYELGVQMYLYGVILLCGVIVIATIQDAPDNWFELFTRGAFRFGELEKNEVSAMALTQNANGLAFYSLTGIFCGVLLAEHGKGGARTWYIILAVLAAVAGFFTVTRSWVLVIALLLPVYSLSKLRTPKQFFALAGILALLTVTCVIIVNNNPRLLDGFVARFAEDDVESGNNRTDLFFTYMEAYFSDLRYILFGSGVTQYRQVLQTGRGAIHNGTQQILVCTGIVGFVLYMFALVGPVLRARKHGKRRAANWLPLLSIVVFVQFIPFLNPAMLMLPYIIGTYALKAGSETKKGRFIPRKEGDS